LLAFIFCFHAHNFDARMAQKNSPRKARLWVPKFFSQAASQSICQSEIARTHPLAHT
jgi:hypothetical protein